MWHSRSSQWLALLVTINCLTVIWCKFLWFEEPPAWDDPCTIVVYGLKKGYLSDFHPKPECLNGGMIWLGTHGRFHLYITYPDPKVEEFQFCLLSSSGLNTVMFWWDFARKHWEPIGSPLVATGISPKEHCRRSVNGTFDLFIESPWHEPRWYSYAKWEIKPIIDGNSTVVGKEQSSSSIPSSFFKQFNGKNYNFEFGRRKKDE